jgi:hypothetical protein
MIFLIGRVFALSFILMGSVCVSAYEMKALAFKAIIYDSVANESLENGYVDTIEIDKKNGVIKYDNGRVLVKLLQCGTKDWVCISDGNLEFSIQKKWKVSEKTWSFRNVEYSVISDVSAADLRDREKIYFILAKRKEMPNKKQFSRVFLYSKARGLIGITMFVEGIEKNLVPVTYVLQE